MQITPSARPNGSSQTAAGEELQTGLLQTIQALSQLLTQLNATSSTRATTASTPRAAEPWREELQPEHWDELSVVELRALLRSYPIDRTSLPAPIELLRRSELTEALSQIQHLGL